ncbi:MAG: hypothetical protein H6Q87_214 [candidate division NC10 bacterium]|nr:hypothetical protein [candidate division NC10 bacterium]
MRLDAEVERQYLRVRFAGWVRHHTAQGQLAVGSKAACVHGRLWAEE